jgi:D-alanyl-D-alanine carboxypeptidase
VVPQLAKIPKGPAGGKLRFNVLAADALHDAWAEVEQMGLLSVVASWDGAYSARVIRGGSSRLSAHACGLAFDINATANAIGQSPKPAGTPGSVADLVPIFEKHGFKWGGNFKPKPDAMHFEFMVPDAVSPAETASAN